MYLFKLEIIIKVFFSFLKAVNFTQSTQPDIWKPLLSMDTLIVNVNPYNPHPRHMWGLGII